MSRPTIKDVAALAGVSAPTASRALNGIRVNPDAARRVGLAVAALGFRRNAFARSMLIDRSSIIGLVMGEGGPDVPGEFQRHAVQICRERAYHLIADQVMAGDSAQTLVATLVDRLRPDGLILWSPAADDPGVLEMLAAASVRFVRLQGDPAHGPTLGVDAASSALAALTIAAEAGAARVVYARGGEPGWISAVRSAVFAEEARSLGVDLVCREMTGDLFEAGAALISPGEQGAAYLCDASSVALGVSEGVRRAGESADALIVCFQDTAALRLTSGSIRRQVLPLKEMAEAAFAQILDGGENDGMLFSPRFL